MRYWYDTEFWERGPDYPISLISLGMVSEDGRELYFQGEWADYEAIRIGSPWLTDNVLPHLNDDGPWLTRPQAAQALEEFMNIESYGKPELWAYYADYDHVVLCQIFGAMIHLPKGWPMYTLDIKQFAWSMGDPNLPEQVEGEHHALADARWNKLAWEFLTSHA